MEIETIKVILAFANLFISIGFMGFLFKNMKRVSIFKYYLAVFGCMLFVVWAAVCSYAIIH